MHNVFFIVQLVFAVSSYFVPDAAIRGSMLLLSFGLFGAGVGWYAYGKRGGNHGKED